MTDAGFPDDKLVRAGVAEGARPRIGDRTHQIVQGLRRLLPVEAAIFRGTTPHIGRPAVILWTFIGGSGEDRRQRPPSSPVAAAHSLRCSVRAASSGPIATACWATISPRRRGSPSGAG